mgnify:CR=1 FL=1
MSRFNVKPYCRFFFLIFLSGFLAACISGSNYAPVLAVARPPNAKSNLYRVKQGDTLYSIAWAFGMDYRALAATNHLKSPYNIRAGQTLRIATAPRPQAKKTRSLRVEPPAKKQPTYVIQWSATTAPHWRWPVRGRVIARFSATRGGNKGINIAGRYGAPIRAAAKGIVVYSGAGVRGYGNLIIVKHNTNYLSAYAFNKRLLVKEGARVRAGQKIAEMGRDDSGKVMLHFEIRWNGKPVNPAKYLE